MKSLKNKKFALLLIFIMLLISGTGCVSVKLVTVDKKTQLENQILGSFQQLQGDLVLVSSVRGEGESDTAISDLHKEALKAVLNRQFNHDDVTMFKEAGVFGEKNNGLLAYFKTERTANDAEFKELAQRILKEENRDREVIMKRVISLNDKLTMKEYPQVKNMMYMLSLQNSTVGHKVQLENGTWQTKTEETAPVEEEK